MSRRDDGFTLIELLVVVLIIAILLATAIPTFLGARERAQDRAAQSNVRNAHTNLMVIYTDDRVFTDSPAALRASDPSITYTDSLPVPDADAAVFVQTFQGGSLPRPDNGVYIAARSGSGRCYWLRTIGDENHPRFAVGSCTAVPTAFAERW